MYYVSEYRDILEDYNDKIVAGENYDGVRCVRWADVIEHQDGDQFAIIKHTGYPLIEGFDDDGESLDAPTVEDIADFHPPLEP